MPSISDKFAKSAPNANTQLSGDHTAGTTTLIFSNPIALPSTTPVWVTMLSTDASGNVTSYESVKGTYIVGSNSLTNCIRGAEGTNQAWAANTKVFANVTAGANNDFVDGILAQHNPDGSHSNITATSVSTASLTVNGVGFTSLSPTGVTVPFAGSSAPTGWLLCDGSAVSRTTYAALFAVTGTAFGAGNGTTTFNLPNLKGKAPFGVDSGQTEFAALGTAGGQKTVGAHTHNITDPTHNHSLNDPSHSHDLLGGVHAGGGGVDWTNNGTNRGSANLNWSDGTRTGGSTTGMSANAASTGITVNNTGTGISGTNNLNPYVSMNYIIKT